ncbi:hypothetical protein [Vagococcus acidifermentans]|uniref:Uncharacterized protein n=1 Tax=Vagococcus acidifermentans TaxID=564710 RepID=A0A430B367_9ENTE|nr:hypothetical protein [Vagococcus acidifermentans]RSU14671.1 hypothetical protein CBF27_01450 [Vagococcus acidifermentans]
MLANVSTLIGMGFFMKVFFDTAKKVQNSHEKHDKQAFKKASLIHIILGIIFVIVGRLIIAF